MKKKKNDCKLPVENVSLSQYPRAKHDVIIGLVNFSHQRLQNIFAILIPSLLQTPDFTRRDKAISLGECFKSNAISEGWNRIIMYKKLLIKPHFVWVTFW